MKLKKEFIVYDTGDETILVPTGDAGFSGIVKGNSTFGYILEMLKSETDEARIITAMKECFDTSEAKIKDDVMKTITQLRSIGAIDG